jgi:hypothetical protein
MKIYEIFTLMISFNLIQGELHDFLGEVLKILGEVQNDLGGGAMG